MDFLGFTKQKNLPLMIGEIDGLSDRQIEIVLGRTGWTGNKGDFIGGASGSALRQRRIVDMEKNRKIVGF